MPILNVKISASRPVDVPQVAATLSQLTHQILHKDPNLTAVAIDLVPPAQWFIAGTSLAEAGVASFWLDIVAVDGTNTKDEKAAYVAAVFEAMSALIGPLHTESYVLVREVKADAYGYGGLTQERRYVERKMKAA
ncbi:4-oxalocrotonate tautomerase [Azorhizobium oxalatiphilum]|uniref:4-oxalocrotonate tautomerase n=1 Tax=Azorhizobium oxalatiphilum TaxID=980631 RepID=A0A917CHK2_9HYPH|nr:4-oxalocrotonate tautomerase family protein [Azorhizobium oxalatiphilum]GGF88028.1 4-oxalocrotonate tautomerase [Azorhizobium oxalatiphilum]